MRGYFGFLVYSQVGLAFPGAVQAVGDVGTQGVVHSCSVSEGSSHGPSGSKIALVNLLIYARNDSSAGCSSGSAGSGSSSSSVP